jgi:hypothetical protein
MSWELLTDSYKKSGIVVALGAGVSVESKLPNWPQLLKRLASEVETSGRRVDYDKLIGQRLPLPVIASIFEEYSRDRKEFVERVRRALYKEFPFFPHGISKENRSQFVRHVREQNPTLHAVATLCAVRTGMDRYIPNPRIRGIVSFNLDALIQAYIYARFEKRLLRTIERASASSTTSKINIYHMHGFLRFDHKASNPSKDCTDVVLTEQDYFNFFNDPNSLFNYTFLYLLREATCLFVGLSMQDENIRRMLHLSKMERWRAWTNEGISPNEARRRSLRHFAILKHSDDLFVDEAIRDSLLPLGTQVLWLNEFKEIPDKLRAMYESTGHAWSAVS